MHLKRRFKNIINDPMKYVAVFPKWFLKKTVYKLLMQSTYIHKKNRIEGCSTINHGDLIYLKTPFVIEKSMEDYVDEFLAYVKNMISEKRGASILRLGDGEAFFLQGKDIGNIKKRHLTNKSINEIDLAYWNKMFLKNDFIMLDTNPNLRKIWIPVIGKEKVKNYFPLAAIYGTVANRKLFEVLSGSKVGIIGPKKKNDIIKELIKSDKYREYLGVDSFEQYIDIPEIGACNDTDSIVKSVSEEIDKHQCDVYLVGMGIAKLVILSELKDKYDSLFIDIGSGIDAIAGIIHAKKPWFAEWTNFQIKSYNYKNVDILWKDTFYKESKVEYID